MARRPLLEPTPCFICGKPTPYIAPGKFPSHPECRRDHDDDVAGPLREAAGVATELSVKTEEVGPLEKLVPREFNKAKQLYPWLGMVCQPFDWNALSSLSDRAAWFIEQLAVRKTLKEPCCESFEHAIREESVSRTGTRWYMYSMGGDPIKKCPWCGAKRR